MKSTSEAGMASLQHTDKKYKQTWNIQVATTGSILEHENYMQENKE